MQAFKKNQIKVLLCPVQDKPGLWDECVALTHPGSAASPLLLFHRPYPISLEQDAGLLSSLPTASSKALFSFIQAALAPSTAHTKHYTARPNSLHLLLAPKYVCKDCTCTVYIHIASTCPSGPMHVPTMAPMTNHLSASLHPSPGGCCCFYS